MTSANRTGVIVVSILGLTSLTLTLELTNLTPPACRISPRAFARSIVPSLMAKRIELRAVIDSSNARALIPSSRKVLKKQS